jgi:S1-C subfamily serine protease
MADRLPPLTPRPTRDDELPPIAPRRAPVEGLPSLGPRPPRPPEALPALGRVDVPPAPPRRAAPPPAQRGSRVAIAVLVIAGMIGAGAIGAVIATIAGDDSTPAAVRATPATPAGNSLTLVNAVATATPSVVEVRSGAGQGSGVVVAPRGLIVTNQHVVGNADRVTVVTADNREIPAVVEVRDTAQDLAILRPNGVAGPGAQIAAEPDGGLRVGDQVFAIGSPFNLPGTVTAGVVSTLGRMNGSGVPMIQTDAPINPGNSGGGLFDLRGRLVGIPTAIAAPIRGNVGIGFAVPAARLRALLERVD